LKVVSIKKLLRNIIQGNKIITLQFFTPATGVYAGRAALMIAHDKPPA
jgi:hypothetical protein